MKNLKYETLEHMENNGKSIENVDYCLIKKESCYDEDKLEYCRGNMNIDSLNFTYDNGYGSQEISGFIVYKDGTWSQRSEYDGSEWWEYMKKPILEEKK